MCSSTRAELVAMRAALEEVQQLRDDLDETPLILCTDSQAALATLATGAGAQKSALGAAIWRLLTSASGGRQVHLQWIPAHCGLHGNERADELAIGQGGLQSPTGPSPCGHPQPHQGSRPRRLQGLAGAVA